MSYWTIASPVIAIRWLPMRMTSQQVVGAPEIDRHQVDIAVGIQAPSPVIIRHVAAGCIVTRPQAYDRCQLPISGTITARLMPTRRQPLMQIVLGYRRVATISSPARVASKRMRRQ